MMSRILGNHSDIFSFHELHFIDNQISLDQVIKDYHPSANEKITLLSTLLRSQREGLYSNSDLGKYHTEAKDISKICRLNPSSMDLFQCFCLYEANKNSKSMACEQTPNNIYYVEEIQKFIANSKFINMYRDPRDVMLSQKRRWKRRFLGAKQVPLFRETVRSWLNYHPITMSKLWNSAIKESLRFTDNDSFLSVKFESLLNEPDAQIRRICGFLGVGFDVNMSKVPHVGSSSGMDSANQNGIDKTKQANWNDGGLTRGEIGICQKICRPQMDRLGYEVHDIKNLWYWWVVYGVSFFFKMTGALLFNMSRTQGLFATIKRRFG